MLHSIIISRGTLFYAVLTSGHRTLDNPPSGRLCVVIQGREDGFKGSNPKVIHACLTCILLTKAHHVATSNFKAEMRCNPPLCSEALKELMFYPFNPQFSHMQIIYSSLSVVIIVINEMYALFLLNNNFNNYYIIIILIHLLCVT